MTTGKKSRRINKPLWMIPLFCIVLLVIGIGGYYVYGAYDDYRAEQQRIQESSIQASIAESAAQAELAAMRQSLDREVFYDGIWIDDINLAGKTYEAAKADLQQADADWRAAFGAVLKFEDQTWPLTAADANLLSDWQAILDRAWQTGRSSSKTDPDDQTRERFAAIEALKQNPLRLSVTRSFDQNLISARITEIAAALAIEPVGAKATKFDLAEKKFIICEQKTGRTLNGDACAQTILGNLASGRYGEPVTLTAQTVTAGMTAAAMQSRLGLISKAVTYANKVNPPRDNNIRLICQKLNGFLLQPGETFSFNGYIGKRTAEKGFQEAGGIRDGILIAELGGGICQPNTTLCHAVLKADLEIVERHPHSWPSDYAPVGLDATVTWGGADFKFKNNTDYPFAIVASYNKPSIMIQIYGKQLDDGVTIELETEHNGYIPEKAPLETFNPDLKPGTRLEIRAPHTGQRATAFKVWKKNGATLRREVAFTSYYRPIQGKYEYGPPAPAKPVPTTVAPETTTGTTAETAAETTIATTTAGNY